LLRFLEDGTFTRVGGTQELRVDVRLIAATNRDIIEAIREKNSGRPVHAERSCIPPAALRERNQDVLLLANASSNTSHEVSKTRAEIFPFRAAEAHVASFARQRARVCAMSLSAR